MDGPEGQGRFGAGWSRVINPPIMGDMGNISQPSYGDETDESLGIYIQCGAPVYDS